MTAPLGALAILGIVAWHLSKLYAGHVIGTFSSRIAEACVEITAWAFLGGIIAAAIAYRLILIRTSLIVGRIVGPVLLSERVISRIEER